MRRRPDSQALSVAILRRLVQRQTEHLGSRQFVAVFARAAGKLHLGKQRFLGIEFSVYGQPDAGCRKILTHCLEVRLPDEGIRQHLLSGRIETSERLHFFLAHRGGMAAGCLLSATRQVALLPPELEQDRRAGRIADLEVFAESGAAHRILEHLERQGLQFRLRDNDSPVAAQPAQGRLDQVENSSLARSSRNGASFFRMESRKAATCSSAGAAAETRSARERISARCESE